MIEARSWTDQTAHGTALVLGEIGILIRGQSGAGKSSLALALVESARPPGESVRLVGDDRLQLRIVHGRLVARAHPRLQGLIERRGEGLLAIPTEPAAVIRCIVDFLDPESGRDIPPRLPLKRDLRALIGGVEIARLGLPQRLAAQEAVWRVRGFVRRLAN